MSANILLSGETVWESWNSGSDPCGPVPVSPLTAPVDEWFPLRENKPTKQLTIIAPKTRTGTKYIQFEKKYFKSTIWTLEGDL